MRTIYVEGDSTTFGVLDLDKGGWPNRLHVAMLREATSLDDSTMVINRSMPGRTLPGILREAEANMADFRRYGSVVAMLQTGMNEVKIFRGSKAPIIPKRRFAEQIVRFCDIAHKQDCEPFLVGPPPIDTTQDNPTHSGVTIKDELLAEYGDVMRTVANDKGITYIDTRQVFSDSGRPLLELLAPDGYHPGALGHAAIADAVYSALPPYTPEMD